MEEDDDFYPGLTPTEEDNIVSGVKSMAITVQQGKSSMIENLGNVTVRADTATASKLLFVEE